MNASATATPTSTTLTAVDPISDRPDTGRIDIRDLSLHLGAGRDRVAAVDGLSTTIGCGEFVCVLGPSGCGKSTLLSALAGHLAPTGGEILLDGRRVTGPDADRGLVFQQQSLFPWKSVLNNVAFGLKMRGVPARERRARAAEFLGLVGLAGSEHRYPTQLSGGMQQRAEIARVLVNQPRVVLMDEPFGALDAQTRSRMQELLLGLWERVRTTVVFITHDIDEAVYLADRVLVMSNRPGRIREDIVIDLPRPRPPEITLSASFLALKARCAGLVREEASRGLAWTEFAASA